MTLFFYINHSLFFLQAARRTVGTQKRTFVDKWNNGKSQVHKLQLQFQDPTKAHLHGADNPTYLKKASDKIPAAIGGVLLAFSVTYVGNGMWNMAHGTNKLN